MPSRLRSALVLLLIVGCQAGLVFGAVALSGVNSWRWVIQIAPFESIDLWNGQEEPEPAPTTWSHNFYLGYPIPWLEYREDRFGILGSDGELVGTAVLGRNWAVPSCLVVLALGLPLLAASEVRRWCAGYRGLARPVRSRGSRCLWVVTFAAAGGFAIALLDVTSDPNAWSSVGSVPFSHPPGEWLLPPAPGTPGAVLLKDPPQVEWLRKQREHMFRTERTIQLDPEKLSAEWAARTCRTLAGVAVGLVCGCVLLRPWHRCPLPDKLAVDGKSCPPC
jgi:hypothetical protein